MEKPRSPGPTTSSSPEHFVPGIRPGRLLGTLRARWGNPGPRAAARGGRFGRRGDRGGGPLFAMARCGLSMVTAPSRKPASFRTLGTGP